jgi:hypothetical protein
MKTALANQTKQIGTVKSKKLSTNPKCGFKKA